MKLLKKTQWHTRGLAAQFIDFLHALEYQHINYTLNDIYYVVSTPG